jgi:hypothetical protein
MRKNLLFLLNRYKHAIHAWFLQPQRNFLKDYILLHQSFSTSALLTFWAEWSCRRRWAVNSAVFNINPDSYWLKARSSPIPCFDSQRYLQTLSYVLWRTILTLMENQCASLVDTETKNSSVGNSYRYIPEKCEF